MRVLPDTHVLLWAAGVPKRLTRETRDLIENPETELVFSAASLWETADPTVARSPGSIRRM